MKRNYFQNVSAVLLFLAVVLACSCATKNNKGASNQPEVLNEEPKPVPAELNPTKEHIDGTALLASCETSY